MQGIARLVTQAVSGDSEEQLEEDKEREPIFAPDRNPIEISLGRRNVRLAVRRVFIPPTTFLKILVAATVNVLEQELIT